MVQSSITTTTKLLELYRSQSREFRNYIVGGVFLVVYYLYTQAMGFTTLSFWLSVCTTSFFTVGYATWVYEGGLRLFDKPIGKIGAAILTSILVAVSFANSGNVIAEVTGVDPDQFDHAQVILTPLSIWVFALIALAILVPITMLSLTYVALRTFILKRFKKSSRDDERFLSKLSIRCVASMLATFFFALSIREVYEPSEHHFQNFAARVVYFSDMHRNQPCSFKTQRAKVLDDSHVLVGTLKAESIVFEIRPCSIYESKLRTQ